LTEPSQSEMHRQNRADIAELKANQAWQQKWLYLLTALQALQLLGIRIFDPVLFSGVHFP
jgi:hypothetical protein